MEEMICMACGKAFQALGGESGFCPHCGAAFSVEQGAGLVQMGPKGDG